MDKEIKNPEGPSKGYIRVHRKITDWEWYGDHNTCRLFMHLLYTVNWEDRNWQGKIIPAGARIVTMDRLATEAGMTISEIRTALGHLKKTGEVTVHPSNKYTLITVNNYSKYQPQMVSNQIANESQTNDKQIANKSQSNRNQIAQTKGIKKNYINYKNKQPCASVVDLLTDEEFDRLDNLVDSILELVDWIDDNRDISQISKPYAYCLKIAHERGMVKEQA